MSNTDAIISRFRGPTPPPAVDQQVMRAAAEQAGNLGKGQGPRLSAEKQMSYSDTPKETPKERPKTEPLSREQTAMSDNIVFPCPACGTKYSVSPHHAGKKTTCKKCSAAVTVPTPQVANPTIVGGTRTIRRADIDPGHSTREEAVDTGAAAASVDMTGGASVLRKEETVIGAPPMHATNYGTRAPAPRAGTAGPRPAAPARGRPAAPGVPGVPGKKNNMPMMLGIGGGVLGLILLVVIIVVASGGSGSGQGGGGDGTGGANSGGVAQDPQADPDQKLLIEHRKEYKNVDALSLDQVDAFYDQANERKANPDFKSMRDSWAGSLYRKTESGTTPEKMADVALKLDDAKYPEGRILLDQAWKALKNAGKATTSKTVTDETGKPRKILVPNPKFKDIVTRLGWKPYSRPPEMDDCHRFEVEGAADYNNAYLDIDTTFHDVGLYPAELVDRLKALQETALTGFNELNDRNNKDGFAIKSRMAWIRFKNAQNNKAKVDRVKGKRSFSPLAMERETEDFDDVWTYTYGPSFMVFVEKPIGQDSLDTSFLETLDSKKALLKHLYDWFREHLVDKYNLQRVKPKDSAEQAEREGWPMEIVVLKDRPTFEKYCQDAMGQPMPGARAFYSPLDERVMTYDDRNDSSPDTQWFNESVIIHETFHMLSDFYAAKPHFTIDDIQIRPRYTSILVQEGLTDSVSGFVRGGGDGLDATYEFMQLNHIRLRDFQAIYEILGKKELFRIRDTLECRHYGQCTQKAFERAKSENMKVNPFWLQQVAVGMYYATTCQISFFFQNFKEGGKHPYRELWWKYIGMDYKGEMTLSSYEDTSAITKFKDVFGIKSDKDWDALEKKFLDYTLNLTPENVGKGGTDLKEDEAKKDESVLPGFPDPSGFGQGGGKSAGLPNREEEEAVLPGKR